MNEKRSRVPRVHEVCDDSDFFIGPRTDVRSHVKLEILSVLQEEKGINSYLNLSEDARVLCPILLCDSLGTEEPSFLCRVPGWNIRPFLAPKSRSYQWNSISFTGSNPIESNTLYASRIVTVPDP